MKTILLTNDDGYFSPGLIGLGERLRRSHRVVIVAPDRERSAISMALTLNQPLRVKRLEPDLYAVDGTTADCVHIALQKLMPDRPDFVVSGMNLGENLAEDIFFSGTVGGAFSAMLHGIPGIAVSLLHEFLAPAEPDFAAAAQVVDEVLAKLLDAADPRVVYNLNIPQPNNGRVAVTTLGRKYYAPDIVERTDPRGKLYYWIGTGVPAYGDVQGTDTWAVQNRFISLSAIQYDLNAHGERERLQGLFPGD